MTVHYHEPATELSSETREIHRAIATLVEEWEAVDWYQQRMDLTGDDELRRIVEHNRDEEIEHAMMALEWLRRRVPAVDAVMRTYLFTTLPIVEIEEAAEAGETPRSSGARRGGLRIGALRSGKLETPA